MKSEIPIKIVAWLFIAWVAFLASPRRHPDGIRVDSASRTHVRLAPQSTRDAGPP